MDGFRWDNQQEKRRLLKPFENYNDEAPLASLEVSIAAIASVISEPVVIGGKVFFSLLSTVIVKSWTYQRATSDWLKLTCYWQW